MNRGFRKSQIVFYGVLAAGITLAVTNWTLAGPRPHGKGKHAAEATDTNPAGAKIGEHAPDFTLKDCEGKTHKLSDYTKQGKIVVLEWFNPDCPFIKLHHEKQTTVVDLNKTYAAKDVVILSINSSSSGKEGYGKDADAKKSWKISWPILIDSDGKVGHMYGAKTTPHMFIIDKDGKLRYSGAMDNDPRNEKTGKAKENYVREALDSILAGKTVAHAETKPYGCGVKY
jgi:peroxiredoxin